MKKTGILIVILLVIAVIIFAGFKSSRPQQTETDDTPTTGATNDSVTLTSPRPGAVITSPLTIIGKARGTWFFEASFPVILKNAEGQIVAQGIAQAEGDWMTEDFVPFKSILNYSKPADTINKKGMLILQKDNESDDPTKDDSFQIPVVIN